MTDNHPITPPPKLFRQWKGMPRSLAFEAAYRAGADQELEAICEQLKRLWFPSATIDNLRDARRPKPPSLKEQALKALTKIEDNEATYLDSSVIRRALEALDD